MVDWNIQNGANDYKNHWNLFSPNPNLNIDRSSNSYSST